MKRRVPAILAASALALGAVQAMAPAASAQAAGEDSLAALLTSDGDQFDKNKKDFDIVTEAALAVVAAKPDSPVGLPCVTRCSTSEQPRRRSKQSAGAASGVTSSTGSPVCSTSLAGR